MAKDIADTTVNDLKDTASDQIAELRTEVDKLTASLKKRGFDFLDEAGDQFDEFADDARSHALTAVRQVRHEASAVAEAVKEHPVSTAAAATTFIGIGFAIGYLLGATTPEKRRSFW